MIKKIDSIKNMAVFQDFQWRSSVRDKGNNVVEFKKLNILYGRNYSGKTTLSRIVRALETGGLSDKYISPEFELSFEEGTSVTQDSLIGHEHAVRVFNEDFVKENLHFIVHEEKSINSFAILGEDNAKIEGEIAQLETELGSTEKNTGLRGKMIKANVDYQKAKNTYDDRRTALEDRLRDKATNRTTGIKYNNILSEPNYNITKIRQDIDTVRNDRYSPITSEQATAYQELLKEDPKDMVSESPP